MAKRKSRESKAAADASNSETEEEPARKKKNDGQLSSQEICQLHKLKDVILEYTDADYANLTSYGLFVRMVRPQVSAANSKIAISRMTQLLEAKWREFRDMSATKDDKKKKGTKKAASPVVESEDEPANGHEEDDDATEEEHEQEDDPEEEAGEAEANAAEEDEEEEEEEAEDEEVDNETEELDKEEDEDEDEEKEEDDEEKEEEDDGDETEEEVVRPSKRRTTAPSLRVKMFQKKKSKGRKSALSDDDDDDDQGSSRSSSVSSTRNSRSRRNKKKRPPSSDEESQTSDSEEDSKRKKSSKKRAKKQKQGIEKVKSSKPNIPGERKSGRSHKSQVDVNISDRDFEKMLRAPPSDEEDEKKVKKSKKKKKKKTAPSEENAFFCNKCKDGGDLMLCDACPRSWHKECLELEEVPEGDWKCPKCTGDAEVTTEEEEDEALADHDQFCKVCKDGGQVLLCDFCPLVYHPHCLNPPCKEDELPEGEWKCPRCIVKETPLKGTVRQILFWRWHVPEAPSADVKCRPERQLLVRFKNYSYWDCEWISEVCIEVFSPAIHSNFKKKWNLETAPEPDRHRRRRHGSSQDEEELDVLEEKYYYYGIKPEWLQIHRILNHDGNSKNRSYLVKWKELPYEDSTWEDPNLIPKELKDFNKHVKAYNQLRKRRDEEERQPISKKDIPKKANLKKKMEEQSAEITATGGKLHDYQLEGLNWLRFSWAQDTNTILADEMGLGKTIQASVFLYTLFKEGYIKGPFLISAPLTTVTNWERELALWAPDLYVVTYTGGKEGRAVIREHEFSTKEGAFSSYAKPTKMRSGHPIKFDVLLTSYEFINVDQTALSSINWNIIVIDEAHRLKNSQSLFFRTLGTYKLGYKLLLTGTPLQNNLEELFNLLNFLEPGKFSDMETFLGEFSEVSKDAQVSRLHEMLAPHMLRRMKSDVLKHMPTKTEMIVRVELSTLQKHQYKAILTRNYESLNARGGSCQTSLLNIMMDLRKCCNHAYLFSAAEAAATLTSNGFYEGKALVESSGKLRLLAKMLPKLQKENHRVLIFSQMTRVLDLLEDFMEYMELGYERIDGSISGAYRQECIDRFNSPDSKTFVFLLSTKAGGLGINLATADTVFIYDMDWNPHNDIQAFSRAHRLGQKNKVMIYRFVSRNTVEEQITQVAKKKMMLTELVIHRGMGSEKAETLSKEEVKGILKFGAEDLFKDDSEGKLVYDDEAVEKLLDRTTEGEQEREMGMNDYLKSFRVASYQVKETEEEVEQEIATVEEEQQEEDEEMKEDDQEYWQRVLGDAYSEQKLAELREEERIRESLGKGKRQRKQVKYFEEESSHRDGSSANADNKNGASPLTVGNSRNAAPEIEIEEHLRFFSDYELSTEESEDSDASEAEDSDDEKKNEDKENCDEKEKEREKTKERLKKKEKEKAKAKLKNQPLPPLVARVDGCIEILGFTSRQRRAYLDAIMRYGTPFEDCFKSQWLVRDLRSKSEREFRAYSALFLRHIWEKVAEKDTKFVDGVIREGLSRQHILTRIGMMTLIRRKVYEFEEVNGTDSKTMFEMLEPVPQEEQKSTNGESDESGKVDDEKSDQAVSQANKTKNKECSEEKSQPGEKHNENKSSKSESGDVEDVVMKEKDDDDDVKSDEKSEPMEIDSVERNSKAEENANDDKSAIDDSKTTENDENKEMPNQNKVDEEGDDAELEPEEPPKPPKPKYKRTRIAYDTSSEAMKKRFIICEGAFTELHSLWNLEEASIKKNEEEQTWHRIHDFWLLTGVVTHGYRHWQDIMSDPRFKILNSVFRSDQERLRKAAFLNRRFQLLEHALVVEEQFSRLLYDLGVLPAENIEQKYVLMDRCLQKFKKYLVQKQCDPEFKDSFPAMKEPFENLLADMRTSAFISMPATLLRTVPLQQQSPAVYQRPSSLLASQQQQHLQQSKQRSMQFPVKYAPQRFPGRPSRPANASVQQLLSRQGSDAMKKTLDDMLADRSFRKTVTSAPVDDIITIE